MIQEKVCPKEFTIKINFDDNTTKVIHGAEKQCLVDVLHENHLPITTNCGGKLRCDTCKVKLIDENEYVRSCQYILKENIAIELPASLKQESDTIITSIVGDSIDRTTNLGVAVDIGTTTLGFALVDLDTANIIETYGAFNEQRVYGADVSSRILYGSTKEGLQELQNIILSNLLDGLKHLTAAPKTIKAIALSGNTTMLHLLQGFCPKSLGESPFVPLDVDGGTYSFEQIFHSDFCDCKVEITPCASAYIGSDVVVGAGFLGMGRSDAYQLLVDLGTNGEIILGNKESFYSTSTAAGPAFEASLRYQGVNSTKGIDMIADGIRRGFIQKDGSLAKRFVQKGFIRENGVVIDQKTIREIQLAKGAVCAGIEVLLSTFDISYPQIESVYLAGGFGFHLSIGNAVYIGLIPKELKNKIKIAGNTSLQGTIRYLCQEDFRADIRGIAKKIHNLDLANEEMFGEKFIEQLDF